MHTEESRTEILFHQAAELAGEEREQFLARECADDLALRSLLVRLLAAHEGADDFLAVSGTSDSQPASASDLGDLANQRIGAYRIVRKIGEGGMGAVYLGERADGSFERLVAIKLIRRTRVSAEFLARFERERRIHALLDHEYIAEVYDAGMTPDGKPYLVMEYVDGLPITTYCEGRHLDVPARIGLCRRVCAAVAYAHSHRTPIVHRDLTHRNVLVTEAGIPKILDFGIATIVNAAEDGPTRRGQAVGTPGYWSPQQQAGREAEQADDIYALGALLCRLVTGELPARDSEYDDLPPAAEATREDPGVPHARQLPAGADNLPIDLRTVLAKAIDVDPRQRYASVGDFSEDLRRFLANEPVLARPQSWRYVAGKFISRHRTGVAFAAAGVVAVAAAFTIGLLLWTRGQTEERLAQARTEDLRTLSTWLLRLEDDAAVGGTRALSSMLQQATVYLDRSGSDSQDPRLTIERAAGYIKVADVLGNPNRANLGKPSEARRIYDQAIRLIDLLPERIRAQEPVELLSATAHAHRADVVLSEDRDAAELEYRQALALIEPLRTTGASADADVVAAGIFRPLGDIALDRGNHEAALAEYRRALAIDEALCSRSNRGDYRRQRALSVIRIGDALTRANLFDQALASYTEAGSLLRELDKTTPRREEVQRDLALALGRLGTSMIEHDRPRALSLLDEAAQLLDGLAKSDPTNARAQRDAVVAMLHHADGLDSDARTRDQARTLYREADQRSRSLGDDEEAGRIRSAVQVRLARADGPVANARGRATKRLDERVDRPKLSVLMMASAGELPVNDAVAAIVSGTRVVIRPSDHPGRRRYLLRISGSQAVALLGEPDLRDGHWTFDVSGPPSETWILLVLPRELSSSDSRSLMDQIRRGPFEPSLAPGTRIVWESGSDLPFLRTPSARGGAAVRAETLGPWARRFLAELQRLPQATFSGLTVPVTPPTI